MNDRDLIVNALEEIEVQRTDVTNDALDAVRAALGAEVCHRALKPGAKRAGHKLIDHLVY